jgi:hypothetical protein
MQDKGRHISLLPLYSFVILPQNRLERFTGNFTADTFKIENRAFYAMNYKPFCFLRNF